MHKNLGSMYEYVLCYSKNKEATDPFSVKATEAGKKFPFNNAGNPYSILYFPAGSVTFTQTSVSYEPGDMSKGNIKSVLLDKVNVENHKNTNDFRLEGEFRYNQETLNEIISDNGLITISKSPFRPNYVKKGGEIKKMHNHLTPDTYEVGTNEDGTAELIDLLNKDVFDNPKPSSLVKVLAKSVTYNDHDSIILDFFAGSGTTAHAIMELNAEDGGQRQSISVQMPELLAEKSEAYKAGYRTIADITRARIEKVIAKLKEEKSEQTQDLACAHFKLAPSNFKVWRSDLADVEAVRKQLAMFQQAERSVTSNVQNDESNHIAMLTELLLKNGLGALGVHAISKPKLLASGMTIHRVLMNDDRLLWLCFDAYQQGFNDEVIAANPAQVIMLNSCFNTVGEKADEHISNLQLELQHYDIDLLII